MPSMNATDLQQDSRPVTFGEYRDNHIWVRELVERAEKAAVDKAVREVFSIIGKGLAWLVAASIVVFLLIRIGMALR